MKYKDPEAFRTALEARLRQPSDAVGDLSRRRRTVAFDRLLARLAVAGHDAWLLKGGAALEFRMPERARATRDVDLALTDGHDPADLLLDDLADDPFDDWFSFRVTRRRELSEAPDRGAVIRLSMDAAIGGRTFERFVVDIATGHDVPGTTERVELGRLLGFAGIPVVKMAVIDLRTHWAEKLSAYLRRYDDRPNTRFKDLVDLVLLIENGLEPDDRLRLAVETTFTRRGQPLPGPDLPSMADAWAVTFAGMATELDLVTAVAADAHTLVEDFWRRALSTGDAPRGADAPRHTN